MFEPKTKEPLLSKEIEAIVLRSMGEETSEFSNVVTRSDDVFRYKYAVLKALTTNEDILRTLHHPTLSQEMPLNGDSFRNVCIFDFLKLPDLEQKVKNYVCFDVFTSYGNNRDLNVTLIIRVVSHIDDMVTDHGINRQDLLGLIISNTFDWSHIFGGITMYKDSDSPDSTDKGFVYRDLMYRGTVANNYHSRISH